MKKVLLMLLFSCSAYCQSTDVVYMDKILEENKGKVIYLEFWASWCAPCRKEMKKMHKVLDKYKDKVTVVYLSIELEEDNWKKACIQERIDTEKYNLIFTKFKKSDAMKGLRLDAIPKYAIFDKNGILVNKDASRPSEKSKLQAEFDKYLSL